MITVSPSAAAASKSANRVCASSNVTCSIAGLLSAATKPVLDYSTKHHAPLWPPHAAPTPCPVWEAGGAAVRPAARCSYNRVTPPARTGRRRATPGRTGTRRTGQMNPKQQDEDIERLVEAQDRGEEIDNPD